MSELIDPEPVRKRIDQGVSALFDFNQQVTAVLRTQAADFETLASFFENQKQRCLRVQSDILELAMIAAQNTGDILVSEFGIVLNDDEEADDDEE